MSPRRAAWLLAACVGACAPVPSASAQPVALSTPHSIARDLGPGDTYMGVRLLGALHLASRDVDGHRLGGLSALGVDRDEGILYALSDRAIVFHLAVEFDAEGLLARATALAAYPLRDQRGEALEGQFADAEGLTLRNADDGRRGNSELVVSFERVPRLLRFSPAGELRGAVPLPARLRNPHVYRDANRGLESLARHPHHGYLVAPEQPFRGVDDGHVELHALGTGTLWRYPLAPEPNAGLVDAVVLADGSLLTLERGYGMFFVPLITTLRRAMLPAPRGATLAPATLARLNTGHGWSLDNFEGLADLGGGRIVMVSDDNFQALQSTLLAAFELLDTDASPPAPRDAPDSDEPT